MLTLKENRDSLKEHDYLDSTIELSRIYSEEIKKVIKFYEPGIGSHVFGGYAELRNSEYIDSIGIHFE